MPLDFGSFIRPTAPGSPSPGYSYWFDARTAPGILNGWTGSQWVSLALSAQFPPLPGLTVRADSIPLIASSVTTLRFNNLTINGSGDVFISTSFGTGLSNTDSLTEGSTNLYFTGERAQDAVQSMFVVNTADIAFTYDDANNLLSTQVKSSAITFNKIRNAAQASVLLGAGSTGSGAPYAEITLGSNLSMSGTTIFAASGSSLVNTGFNLTVREEDGSPTITSVTVIRFPNTSVTVNGSGDVSVALTSSGGGGSSSGSGLILVEHKTITANTTSITFSGLDGNTDGVYYWHAKILNNSGAFESYRMLPNGLTSNLRGGLDYVVTGTHVWAGFDSGTVNPLGFSNVAATWVTFKVWIHARKNPNSIAAPLIYDGTAMNFDGTDVWRQISGGVWNDTSTNLTSIQIQAQHTSGLGDGSELWLYKYAE